MFAFLNTLSWEMKEKPYKLSNVSCKSMGKCSYDLNVTVTPEDERTITDKLKKLLRIFKSHLFIAYRAFSLQNVIQKCKRSSFLLLFQCCNVSSCSCQKIDCLSLIVFHFCIILRYSPVHLAAPVTLLLMVQIVKTADVTGKCH